MAEKFDNLLVSRFYKMLSFGLLVRANEFELRAMKKHGEENILKEKVLLDSFNSAEIELRKLSEFLEEQIHYDVVPIQKLIRIQLESGLVTADYLLKNA
mgnify:CR=1 FL=1